MTIFETDCSVDRLFREAVSYESPVSYEAPLSDQAKPAKRDSSQESLEALSRLISVLAEHRRGVSISIAPARPIQATINGRSLTFPLLEAKFMALADEWLDSQSGKSRIDFSHSAHLQIVGMGAAAIPFLLQEIRERSGHWFEAIRSIVGSTPVSSEIRGDFEAVTQAWLKWGSENGYAQMENRKGNVDAVATS